MIYAKAPLKMSNGIKITNIYATGTKNPRYDINVLHNATIRHSRLAGCI